MPGTPDPGLTTRTIADSPMATHRLLNDPATSTLMTDPPLYGRWRHVLIGDGESPHLLKWARALSGEVDLWVASSRGFLPGFDAIVPAKCRLALGEQMDHSGGNVGLLRRLPELGRWLQEVDADWLHPHYLTSHGTLAVGARKGWRLRARIVGSAWGSDILVTPKRGPHYRWVTGQVLRACELTTSDSEHMAAQMRQLGAREVRVFPFGLEQMPPPPARKAPWTFYANRGLEPIYRPERVSDACAAISSAYPEARLTVANDGSLRPALEARVRELGLARHVQFTGRLDAEAQARCYAEAQWYLSLPSSDSVAVSVLEAMAHGCIPVLSDLPANHELVRSGTNGLILTDTPIELMNLPALLAPLLPEALTIGRDNHEWVRLHGQFAPAVVGLLDRLAELTPPR